MASLFRRRSLKLVRSPPAKESFRTYSTERGPVALFQSSFQIAWLDELGIRPDTIVEIGSYDGGDARRFHDAFPRSRVVAIEADPERFSATRENCRNRGIELVEAAILDRDGPVAWHQATINEKVDSQGSLYLQTEWLNRRFPQVQQAAAPMTVPGRRLDTLCAELGVASIDFLHMDIQGAEFVALKGLGDLRPGVIFLETVAGGWVGAGSVKEIADLLEGWGYRLAADLRTDRLYVSGQSRRATR